MKIAEAGRELAFPFTDLAVVQAMIWFWLMGMLIDAAGLLGIWLAAVVVPAFFRYALYLLEARAAGSTPPPPGIELFNLVDGLWSLFPLLLIVALSAGIFLVGSEVSPAAGVIACVLVLLFLPASLAILAITRSPLESLNPLAIRRMIDACGGDYLWVPGSVSLLSAAVALLAVKILPALLVELLAIYLFYLLFTMTGAILHANDVELMVEIPDPAAPDESAVRERSLEARRKVANHAYGFISRGNRAGGLSHIEDWLYEHEADSVEAWDWFFREMLRWESTEHALFFAQNYLSRLLYRNRQAEALKLLSRCLYEDPRFRPLAPDTERVLELVAEHGRDDLLALLER